MSPVKAFGLAAILACLPAFSADPGVPGDHSQPRREVDVQDIAPAPPKGADSPVPFPTTTSHLTLAATFPKAALQAQLDNEKVIPRSFHFDVNDGVRAFGTPSRGAIAVVIDSARKRVSASTGVSGRVQVEKRIVVDLPVIGRKESRPSVGIDVSGDVVASLSPLIGPKWDVNPQLDLSAHLNRAVAKTALFDVEVTGLVRGAVGNAFNGAKGPIEAKLKEAIDFRKRTEKLWDQLTTVHKLGDKPTTWLRIIPKAARFGQFQYAPESISAELALDLETQVFVQDEKPEVVKSPLPDLQIGNELGDGSLLSLAIEVPHEVVNRQLKAQLTKAPMTLPNDAEFTITDASLSSYKGGGLLAVDFRAKQGGEKAASGRLYVTGDVVLDARADELRLSKLSFTTDTKKALDKDADWLGQADPVRPMTDASVIKLGGVLAEAKSAANEQLTALKTTLSKEFAVDIAITDVHVDNLMFAEGRTFAIVTANGKMSAVLKP